MIILIGTTNTTISHLIALTVVFCGFIGLFVFAEGDFGLLFQGTDRVDQLQIFFLEAGNLLFEVAYFSVLNLFDHMAHFYVFIEGVVLFLLLH